MPYVLALETVPPIHAHCPCITECHYRPAERVRRRQPALRLSHSMHTSARRVLRVLHTSGRHDRHGTCARMGLLHRAAGARSRRSQIRAFISVGGEWVRCGEGRREQSVCDSDRRVVIEDAESCLELEYGVTGVDACGRVCLRRSACGRRVCESGDGFCRRR